MKVRAAPVKTLDYLIFNSQRRGISQQMSDERKAGYVQLDEKLYDCFVSDSSRDAENHGLS